MGIGSQKKMKRNNVRSFYLKIALIFSGILIVFGFLVAYMTLQTSSGIVQESIQKTNRDLASAMVKDFEPILQEEMDQEEIESKLRALKGTNPQFDFYLLDSKGFIKSFIPGGDVPSELRMQNVETEALDAFINGRTLPILAKDPLNPQSKKPFSVANISIMGSDGCYLYVVLEGDEFSKTTAMLTESYIAQNALFVIGSVLILALITGLFFFKNLTQRLTTMKNVVSKFERGELSERIPVKGNDEITELSKCFNQMADTLVKNMEEIKKTDNLRRELVANISHDLRSPLSSIQGYIETIQLQGDRITKKQIREYLETVLGNTKKLNRLIDDLFELSKLDAENIQPDLEDVSLAELVQDLVLQFKPIAEKKGVKLTFSVPKQPNALIKADINLLNRAITNLIDNAIQHTPEGGEVTIESVKQGKDFVLSIHDTGIGIPQVDIPHIFDRFYQVDKSRSSGNGTGLGLAIAQRILALHGAQIKVESPPNMGTTFKVQIPT